MVIGIGINVRLDENVRDRIDQPVADLAAAGVPLHRNRILARVLVELADVLGVFAARGFAAVEGRVGELSLALRPAGVGHAVGGGGVGAVVAGVDDDGALLAQTATGLRRFQSGDVSLRLAEDTLPARRMRSG